MTRTERNYRGLKKVDSKTEKENKISKGQIKETLFRTKSS